MNRGFRKSWKNILCMILAVAMVVTGSGIPQSTALAAEQEQEVIQEKALPGQEDAQETAEQEEKAEPEETDEEPALDEEKEPEETDEEQKGALENEEEQPEEKTALDTVDETTETGDAEGRQADEAAP